MTQQTFVDLQEILKTSSRHIEDVFNVTIFRLPRRLQDLFKRNSKCLVNTSSRFLQDVLEDKKLLHWRRLQDMFWSRLPDVWETNKMLTGKERYLFLTYLNLHLTNLCLANLHLTNPRSINCNPIQKKQIASLL